VQSFGINVTIIEPGFFRTDFLDPSSAQFSGNHFADYDVVRDEPQTQYKEQNHQQQGDPAKLGPVIFRLANAAAPPRHLPLGSDAVQYARDELQSRLTEIDAWAELAVSTDHDDAA
jgi:hypothetical protein